MSHSSTGKIPNQDQLYADPARTLAQEEVRIAPAGKRTLFVGIVALALLAPLLIRYKMGLALSVQTHAAIMAAIVVVGVLLVAVCPFGVELVLTTEGVRFRRRATEVLCPWALFNASGNPFFRSNELILPVASVAIPYIRQYHYECLVRQGVQIKNALLKLQDGNQAVLLNQSTAPSQELGRLLLHLGRTLGGRLPDESVPTEACPATERCEERYEAGRKRGWITLSLTRLVFPPTCCDCGLAADTFISLDLGLHVLWSLACLGHYNEKVRVAVPICQHCQEATRGRQRRRQWSGAAIGMFFGLLATCVLVGFRAVADPIAVSCVGVVIGFIGLWVGLEIGRACAPFPVRGYYAPRNNTVALRFRRPDYADVVGALVQHGSGALFRPGKNR
jgi:hypothetical protein